MTPKEIWAALLRETGLGVQEITGLDFHAWRCGGRHQVKYLHATAGGGAVVDAESLGHITVFPTPNDPGMRQIAYYIATG